MESIGISAHQTSVYVVVSRVFQSGQLTPWLDLTTQAKVLRKGEALSLERVAE